MAFKDYVLIEKKICSKVNKSLLAKVFINVKEVIKRKFVRYHSIAGKLII